MFPLRRVAPKQKTLSKFSRTDILRKTFYNWCCDTQGLTRANDTGGMSPKRPRTRKPTSFFSTLL